jgi:hypothetical protein
VNRRNFLRSLVGGVAAAAAVRTFPFRVFSFPKETILNPWRYFGPSQMFGGEPSFLDRTVGPLSLHGLPNYIGDEDHPITSGTFYGIQRGDVRRVIPDKGFLPLGSAPPRIKSVDVERKIITWESA